MNYYIDFDNTIYETAKLTEKMLNAIINAVSQKDVENKIKSNFNSSQDNIYTYAEKIAEEYGINKAYMLEQIENIIKQGHENVFEDAERYLQKLKKQNENIFLLTYISDKNQEYQMKKILGSGLEKYFTGIIITTKYKFLLDIDYKNGIFIDDDPRDLKGLYEKKPQKVIRIRKDNNKRSKIELENKNIEEYQTFDDII